MAQAQPKQAPQLGVVRGKGTSTSDSIPAKLSKNEVVLNAGAAQALQQMLGKTSIADFNAQYAPQGAETHMDEGMLQAAGGYPDKKTLPPGVYRSGNSFGDSSAKARAHDLNYVPQTPGIDKAWPYPGKAARHEALAGVVNQVKGAIQAVPAQVGGAIRETLQDKKKTALLPLKALIGPQGLNDIEGTAQEVGQNVVSGLNQTGEAYSAGAKNYGVLGGLGGVGQAAFTNKAADTATPQVTTPPPLAQRTTPSGAPQTTSHAINIDTTQQGTSPKPFNLSTQPKAGQGAPAQPEAGGYAPTQKINGQYRNDLGGGNYIGDSKQRSPESVDRMRALMTPSTDAQKSNRAEQAKIVDDRYAWAKNREAERQQAGQEQQLQQARAILLEPGITNDLFGAKAQRENKKAAAALLGIDMESRDKRAGLQAEQGQYGITNQLAFDKLAFDKTTQDQNTTAATAKAQSDWDLENRKLGQPKPITTNTYDDNGAVNGQQVGVVQYDADGNPSYKPLGGQQKTAAPAAALAALKKEPKRIDEFVRWYGYRPTGY